MAKISLEDLIKVLNFDVAKHQACTEILFALDNDEQYKHCWMGKMPNPDDRSKELYWFGLTPDGSQAYDYDTAEEILNAKVFHGKSLSDVIQNITWLEIDGCGVKWRLPDYLYYWEQDC